MQIKYRITFLYSLIVMVIITLLCCSTYFAVSINRQDAVKKRLMNRAQTTATRLFQFKNIDASFLQKLDKTTKLALTDRYLAVYDQEKRTVYLYKDDPSDSIAVNSEILASAHKKGGYYFQTADNKDAVAFYTSNGKENYLLVSAAYDGDGYSHLANLRFIFLVSIALASLIVFASGYLFSKGILSPINRMTRELNSISTADLSKRLSTGSGKDELEKLAMTVNELLSRLNNSFETQTRFISNASHELCTPLTSISNELQVAFQQERTVQEYKKVFNSVYEDVQHLSLLTRALLELAKASGTPGGLKLEQVRVDELLLEMSVSIKRLNPAFSLELVLEQLPDDEQSLLVYGSRELLTVALKNIVENACKFSSNGSAAVSLSYSASSVSVSVSNTGPTIPTDEFDNIFMPFYRNKERSSNVPGFGLGLSLSQRIIRLHKGNIELRSQDGKTVFLIVIPTVIETE